MKPPVSRAIEKMCADQEQRWAWLIEAAEQVKREREDDE